MLSAAPGPATPPPSRRPSLWSALAGLALLAVVIGFAVTHVDEERGLAQLLTHAQPAWLVLAAACQVGTYAATGAGWGVVLRASDAHLPLRTLARFAIEKLFVDRLVPSGGLGGTVMVAHALVTRGVAPEVATTALLVDLLGYYFAFVAALLLALAALWIAGGLDSVVLLVALAFLLVAGFMAGAILFVTRARGWSPPRWVRRIPAAMSAIEALAGVSPELMRHPGLIARTTAWQFVVFLLDGATFAAVLLALGEPPRPIAAFTSQVLAQAAATVGIVPAGLGTYEAAAVAMLSVQGVPLAAALAGTLLLRGFTLWVPLLPGFLLARHDLLAR